MENENELMKIYYEKKNDFLRLNSEYKYIFEVTKCCGYGEWVTVYKDQSTSHLYDNVQYQFPSSRSSDLYIVNNNGEKLIIPCDGLTSIRTFILNNNSFFIPIYPIPSSVIYKIYYDGCCCVKIEKENNENN